MAGVSSCELGTEMGLPEGKTRQAMVKPKVCANFVREFSDDGYRYNVYYEITVFPD